MESTPKGYKEQLSTRLSSVREDSGLSQSKFSARFGVKQQTWANYEVARTMPSPELIAQIATDMEYDPAWLLTGEGDPRRSSLPVPVKVDALQAQIADLERQLAEVEEARERDLNRIEFESEHLADSWRELEGKRPTVRVPVYDVPLNASPPDPGANYEEVDALVSYEDAYLDWLKDECRIDPSRAFYAPVRGPSMESRLYDGDWVLGETQNYVEHDDIYALVLNGRLLVKYVRPGAKRGDLNLISENTAFPAYVASESHGDTLHIIGRVVRRIVR